MRHDHEALRALLASKKKARPKQRPWLDVETLPPLVGDDDQALGPEAVKWLLATQEKHKAIEAAGDVAPWLEAFEAQSARTFALAMLERWIASPQDAKDRFALTFAGLFGGDSIIDVLLPRIQGWCDQSRHKLAEYAADAIALLGSDRSLAALDALRTQFRRRYKNVGAAANRAFERAASKRGMSTDELGDLVMPTHGFDEEGTRLLEWQGAAVRVEIGVDCKLAFHGVDQDEGKDWKKLPASAPAEVHADVKAIAKDLRTTFKAQTQRLEQALVRSRRWPKARFEEVFLKHPIGRVFASRQVFGVYGKDGALLRCLRRYPNGILADAAGQIDDIEEPDLAFGFVHPLELGAEASTAWKEHFARAKTQQLFPQLERPVVLLEAAHENRRKIDVACGHKLSAGTFRGRAERLGWQRGSVVDAGGVPSFYKDFAESGVEVELEIEGYYISIDPMEQVELGAARFVRAGSIARGGYTYDVPGDDDPRVLRFGEVPSILYSEALADLRTMIGAALS